MCHCITIEGGSFGEKELDIYNLKVGTVEKIHSHLIFNFNCDIKGNYMRSVIIQ